MLKKEMVAKTADEGHVLMTVEQVFRPVGDMDVYYAGWDEGDFGNVNRIPYWKTTGSDRVLKALFCSWQFDSVPNKTTVKRFEEREYTGPIEIEINGAKVSCNFDVTQTVIIDGDPFNLKGSVGKVIPIRFTPPLQDISKKVKQVFTSSQKEGVVNAWEGNVGGRVYFGAHSHNKVSHGIGDGVGVSPNDLSPLWKVDLGESRRRYHHGHSDVRDRRGYKRPCFYPHFWRRPYTSNTCKYDWNIEHRSSARDYVLQDQRQIEGCVRRIHPFRRNIGLSKEVPYAA